MKGLACTQTIGATKWPTALPPLHQTHQGCPQAFSECVVQHEAGAATIQMTSPPRGCKLTVWPGPPATRGCAMGMRGKMQDPPAPNPYVISASLPGSLLGHPVSACWKIGLGKVKSVLAESQSKWERTSGWLCCQWEEICALDAATLNQVIKCQKICNVLVCSRLQWRWRLGGGLGFFFLFN